MKISDPTLASFTTSAVDAQAEGAADRLSSLKDKRDPKSIDKAAREFEAFFVQSMLKEMRKTIPHGEENRNAMDTFESMFDESIARRISQGEGIGLANQ